MSLRSRGRVRVNACAKINLTLRVLGVRPDGYHELRTVFQSIALHDSLTFTATRGAFEIECDEPGCPVDRTNIVWGVAARLWRALGRRGAPRGVRVRLAKRIPLQAGLGGGSSDAAAALRGLTTLWTSAVPEAKLREIGAALGADVPFFLEGGSALGVERGDVVFPLADLPSSWVTLVLPAFGVSTPAAYRWFDGAAPKTVQLRRWRLPSLPAFELRNDLEPPVSRQHPEIGRIVGRLASLGADYAAMSGSGSAVFGLFRSAAEAENAAAALKGPARRAIVTKTLTRSEFTRFSRPR